MAGVANDLQVNIEYDSSGKRATKHFEDVYAGKRFYIAKLNANKNPAVVGQPTPDDWRPADPEPEQRSCQRDEAIEGAETDFA